MVLASLVLLFLAFSLSLYLRPALTPQDRHSEAGRGKLVWQKYNCQSCHQLYGLGGYLGPDLTNVISEPGKGPTYVLAMVRSGVRQMPSFRLSKEEAHLLLEFLRDADKSGDADPRSFRATATGMIHPQ